MSNGSRDIGPEIYDYTCTRPVRDAPLTGQVQGDLDPRTELCFSRSEVLLGSCNEITTYMHKKELQTLDMQGHWNDHV